MPLICSRCLRFPLILHPSTRAANSGLLLQEPVINASFDPLSGGSSGPHTATAAETNLLERLSTPPQPAPSRPLDNLLSPSVSLPLSSSAVSHSSMSIMSSPAPVSASPALFAGLQPQAPANQSSLPSTIGLSGLPGTLPVTASPSYHTLYGTGYASQTGTFQLASSPSGHTGMLMGNGAGSTLQPSYSSQAWPTAVSSSPSVFDTGKPVGPIGARSGSVTKSTPGFDFIRSRDAFNFVADEVGKNLK